MTTPSLGNAHYFMLCKDRATSYRYIYFFNNKGQSLQYIEALIKDVKRDTGRDIKTIRSDCGTEFLNQNVRSLFEKLNIALLPGVAHCHQQNGYIERDMRTVGGRANACLHDGKYPKGLWAEAAAYSVYSLNIVPIKGLKWQTPFELWFGKKPRLTHLAPFGCKAFKRVNVYRRKFESKAEDHYLMVGYEDKQNAYRLYNIKTRKIEFGHRNDVILNEKIIGIRKSNEQDDDDDDGPIIIIKPFEQDDQVASSDESSPKSDSQDESSEQDDEEGEQDEASPKLQGVECPGEP